jgi:hypothetical protein
MQHDVAEDRITKSVDKVRAQFRNDDLGVAVDLAPEEVIQKYTTAAKDAYDKNLRAAAATLQNDLQNAERALQLTVDAAKTLPHPVDALELQALSDTTRSTERLRIVLEQDRAERRLQNKTIAEVANLYEQAKPERDGVLLWHIESQHAAGWSETALAPSNDVVSGLRLKRLIEERQDARIKTNFPELAQARERLSKLKTATLDHHFKHLLSGRGLAAVR